MQVIQYIHLHCLSPVASRIVMPRLSKIPGYATAADHEFLGPRVESKDQR